MNKINKTFLMTTRKQIIQAHFYPKRGTPDHGGLTDTARNKRTSICNLWIFCKQKKITFNNITCQKGIDMEKSISIHANKHPEIVDLGKSLFHKKVTNQSPEVFYLLAIKYLAKVLLKKVLRDGQIPQIECRNTMKSAFTFDYNGKPYVLVIQKVIRSNEHSIIIVNGVTCYEKTDAVEKKNITQT